MASISSRTSVKESQHSVPFGRMNEGGPQGILRFAEVAEAGSAGSGVE